MSSKGHFYRVFDRKGSLTINSSGFASWANNSWIVRKVSKNSSRGMDTSLVSVRFIKVGEEGRIMFPLFRRLFKY